MRRRYRNRAIVRALLGKSLFPFQFMKLLTLSRVARNSVEGALRFTPNTARREARTKRREQTMKRISRYVWGRLRVWRDREMESSMRHRYSIERPF